MHHPRRNLRPNVGVAQKVDAAGIVERLRLRLADVVQESRQLRQRAAMGVRDEFGHEMLSPALPPFEPSPQLIPQRARRFRLGLALSEHHVEPLDHGQAMVEDVPVMLLRLFHAARDDHFRQHAVE